MIGIYKITNPKGKIYIGKSKHIEQRFKDYFPKVTSTVKEQRKLYYSLLKYGPENHIFEIIEECSLEETNTKEIYYIKLYGSVETGLNLTFGGDGGNMCKESEELRRINSMKPILQYDLKGNFIQEYRGAREAIKDIGYGNGNNINDCARGIYKSTYGFIWKYKIQNLIPPKITPPEKKPKGCAWTEERRLKTKESRKGEKRSEEYSKKISELKKKKVYQYDSNNNLANIFPSFGSMNGSKIIGTKKLGKIINKDEYYNGFRYSFTYEYPEIFTLSN